MFQNTHHLLQIHDLMLFLLFCKKRGEEEEEMLEKLSSSANS
jgi:hypothetical protein